MSTSAEKPRRRRLRFSVRILMLLVLLVGACLGWWVDRVNRANRQRRAVAAILKAHGRVWYDYEFSGEMAIPIGNPWAPEWLRKRFGDEFFQEVTMVAFQNPLPPDPAPEEARESPRVRLAEAQLAAVEGLDRLERLYLVGSWTTDDGLERLKRLARLRYLNLAGTRVKGPGLAHLTALHELRELSLVRTKVDDDGLANLRGLRGLRKLNLYGTKVTDAGLAHLAGLTGLEELTLSGTKVTDTGLAHLKRLSHLRTLDFSGQ